MILRSVVVLTLLNNTVACSGQEIRVVNHSGSPICITLVSGSRTAEKWIDDKAVTDIRVRIDHNERVLIVRQAETASEKRLAEPVRVLATHMIRTDAAESGCIFVYLHKDDGTALRSDLLCLGPGKYTPFDRTDKSLQSYEEAMKTLRNALLSSTNVDVNAEVSEYY